VIPAKVITMPSNSISTSPLRSTCRGLSGSVQQQQQQQQHTIIRTADPSQLTQSPHTTQHHIPPENTNTLHHAAPVLC
jgi:hypothetical protein